MTHTPTAGSEPDSEPVPDVEYQYGVMFRDGSVQRSWNGNTQERRAREHAAKCQAAFPGDGIRAVRRLIGPWEELDASAPGERGL